MRLLTYLFKKASGKLKNQQIKIAKPQNTTSLLGGAQCDGRWGELSEDIKIDKPIVRAQDCDKDGGGWNLIINNYTKCDVPSYISWDMVFYRDTDSGDLYVRSQTKEEIKFLFWTVATLYSFDTWLRLPGNFFDGTKEQQTAAIKKVFDFTDHGASNGHGITMNSRMWIDRKNPKHKIELGTMTTISGGGRNDSDYIIVNF